MAMSVENNDVDLRAESTSGNCLNETEVSMPDMEGSIMRKLSGRKRRILYDREFLIKCFHSPASTRKPRGFPIPHLDCTLAASKVKRLPLTAQVAPAYQLKRKDDVAKRDREGEDNISLRPHSGNFSAGCGPNLSSPSHVSSTSSFSRIHSQHEDSSKGYDRDRDYHRNNFRYGNHRRDPTDRNRLERDRDLDGRDHRDRMSRDRLSGSNHRNSNSWSNDGNDSSDWSRRRNGAHFPRDRDYNTNSNKRYSDRGREDEKEPEWFSGGPSSQHETIELRGFLDDDRREKSDERRNGIDKDIPEQNGEVDSSGESTKNDNNCESPMDLSIEKILKMDHIPGILNNDFLETEEPSGSSRFSKFFMQNSATPDPGHGMSALGDPQDNAQFEDKNKAVHEMGELLRNMLIKKNAPVDPSPEPKAKEAAKPPSATKDDVDAFKKLVTPLLEKVLQGPANTKKPQLQPGRSPIMDDGQQYNSGNGGNVLDIFKQPPQQKSHPQQVQVPEEPSRNNSLQDIFNNMMNKPAMPLNQMDNVPRLNPNQILQMIPPDLHHLVMNLNISQWDYVQLANIAKSNDWSFRHVLDNFIIQQCPPQQHMVYTGVLSLLISGKLSLPGVIVVEPPVNHVVPHLPQPIMPNHRAPNPNFEKFMSRPVEEPQKDMTKRSATPVSSMAFTPTSVMRKMTADGGKSIPPTNPTGFVPVPISGGLLPTPPTTAPVMMNSNNPNLATLMSNMGRAPLPHMQFRPPPQPMGYPPNPGFHPSMMPPNMHGPVMMPPPFQNIIPNQPIYTKSDEN